MQISLRGRRVRSGKGNWADFFAVLQVLYYNAINFPSVAVVLFPNVKRDQEGKTEMCRIKAVQNFEGKTGIFLTPGALVL